MDLLPNEILVSIFGYMDKLRYRAVCAQVCSFWYTLIASDRRYSAASLVNNVSSLQEVAVISQQKYKILLNEALGCVPQYNKRRTYVNIMSCMISIEFSFDLQQKKKYLDFRLDFVGSRVNAYVRLPPRLAYTKMMILRSKLIHNNEIYDYIFTKNAYAGAIYKQMMAALAASKLME